MKLFFLTAILMFAASVAEEVMRKEYKDLLRDVRHDSSNEDSAEQIHIPQLGFGHPKLHVHHHKRKHHNHGDGADAGHILASWHQDDGHDKSSSSSSSNENLEQPQLEACTCQQTITTPTSTPPPYAWYQYTTPQLYPWGTPTTITMPAYQWDPYATSSWYTPVKRSFQNGEYTTTYSGFRLKGEHKCFCPEMHLPTIDQPVRLGSSWSLG